MMTLIEGSDYFVQIIDLKNSKVREAVTENEDGTYTIFINANQSDASQLRRYEHALFHIIAGDFEKEYADVQYIESEAHF